MTIGYNVRVRCDNLFDVVLSDSWSDKDKLPCDVRAMSVVKWMSKEPGMLLCARLRGATAVLYFK